MTKTYTTNTDFTSTPLLKDFQLKFLPLVSSLLVNSKFMAYFPCILVAKLFDGNHKSPNTEYSICKIFWNYFFNTQEQIYKTDGEIIY